MNIYIYICNHFLTCEQMFGVCVCKLKPFYQIKYCKRTLEICKPLLDHCSHVAEIQAYFIDLFVENIRECSSRVQQKPVVGKHTLAFPQAEVWGHTGISHLRKTVETSEAWSGLFVYCWASPEMHAPVFRGFSGLLLSIALS